MSFLKMVINGVTRLNDRIGRLIAPLVFVMSGLLICEVILRYFFDSPTVWTSELTQYLFGVYSIMAGGYVLAHGAHVNVDLLYSRFSVRGRAIIDIFTAVVFYLFVLAFLYFASSMAWESIQSRETSYSAWNPPVWPFKALVPVAVFLVLLQGTVKFLRDIAVAIDPDTAGDLKAQLEDDDGVGH